jgi:anti-anti-sigma factor
MSVVLQEVGQVVVLMPSETLYEGRECDELEARMLALVRNRARVVVDLSHVHPLTAHCVGVLANAQHLAVQCGGRIALCGASSLQRRLLAELGLAHVLPVHDDRDAAVRSLNPNLRSAA